MVNDLYEIPRSERREVYEQLCEDSATLERLKESETIRLVIDRKYTPKDLDNAMRNMKKRIQELEHIRQMDMAQIVEQRRQIDFLMGD